MIGRPLFWVTTAAVWLRCRVCGRMHEAEPDGRDCRLWADGPRIDVGNDPELAEKIRADMDRMRQQLAPW